MALHLLGRDDEAVEQADEELALSQAWGAPVDIGVALKTRGLITGGTDGLAMLDDAVALLERTSSRLDHARTLVEYGAALRRANRRTDARERLYAGAELASRIGALALMAQANQGLAATGARPRSLTKTGPETLTASELRGVAQLATEGMSNKEIAQALFLTVKTIEVHLSSACRKLDITSRRQLGSALSADKYRDDATSPT